MKAIRWSLPAAEDLERICERIERDNADAARQVARAIYHGCERLKDFPFPGRTSNRPAGRRELVFSPLSYIAVYQVTETAIEISRIFHGHRIGRSDFTITGAELSRKWQRESSC